MCVAGRLSETRDCGVRLQLAIASVKKSNPKSFSGGILVLQSGPANYKAINATFLLAFSVLIINT